MTNGERETWAGMVARITTALPPGFIAVLGMNLLFLALLFWFLDKQVEGRMALVSKLIDTCTNNLK